MRHVFNKLKSNPARKAGNMGREKSKEMLFWTTEEYTEFFETMMNKPLSFYAFEDGTLMPSTGTAVENEAANDLYQRPEIKWLIYNDPLSYAELVLNSEPDRYLKTVIKKVWPD